MNAPEVRLTPWGNVAIRIVDWYEQPHWVEVGSDADGMLLIQAHEDSAVVDWPPYAAPAGDS